MQNIFSNDFQPHKKLWDTIIILRFGRSCQVIELIVRNVGSKMKFLKIGLTFVQLQQFGQQQAGPPEPPPLAGARSSAAPASSRLPRRAAVQADARKVPSSKRSPTGDHGSSEEAVSVRDDSCMGP